MNKKKDEKKTLGPEFDFDANEFPELFDGEAKSKITEEKPAEIVKEETPVEIVKEETPVEAVIEEKSIATTGDTQINHESITTPAGESTRMVLTRLGVIFSNLAIIFAILAFLSVVSVFLSFLYYIFLVMIVLVTLFTVLANPEFRKLFSGGGKFTEFIQTIVNIAPIFMGLSGACSLFAIILLATDKHHRHTGRIVFSGISLGIVVLAGIILGMSAASKGGN